MAELSKELEDFDSFVTSLGLVDRLTMVTICRSVRDGYFPRRLVNSVEAQIFSTLRKTSEDLRVLLDGRPTW